MTDCKFKKELEDIIVGGDSRTLVETAQKIANDMIRRKKNGNDVDERYSVSTSQIRNIYGTCKRIEMTLDDSNVSKMFDKLILLKPKMAYASGRHNKRNQRPGFKTLVSCLSHAIDKVDGNKQRMKNFFDFFEAILAYHRYEGGR